MRVAQRGRCLSTSLVEQSFVYFTPERCSASRRWHLICVYNFRQSENTERRKRKAPLEFKYGDYNKKDLFFGAGSFLLLVKKIKIKIKIRKNLNCTLILSTSRIFARTKIAQAPRMQMGANQFLPHLNKQTCRHVVHISNKPLDLGSTLLSLTGSPGSKSSSAVVQEVQRAGSLSSSGWYLALMDLI